MAAPSLSGPAARGRHAGRSGPSSRPGFFARLPVRRCRRGDHQQRSAPRLKICPRRTPMASPTFPRQALAKTAVIDASGRKAQIFIRMAGSRRPRGPRRKAGACRSRPCDGDDRRQAAVRRQERRGGRPRAAFRCHLRRAPMAKQLGTRNGLRYELLKIEIPLSNGIAGARRGNTSRSNRPHARPPTAKS